MVTTKINSLYMTRFLVALICKNLCFHHSIYPKCQSINNAWTQDCWMLIHTQTRIHTNNWCWHAQTYWRMHLSAQGNTHILTWNIYVQLNFSAVPEVYTQNFSCALFLFEICILSCPKNTPLSQNIHNCKEFKCSKSKSKVSHSILFFFKIKNT
jgi:hypothetical protein